MFVIFLLADFIRERIENREESLLLSLCMCVCEFVWMCVCLFVSLLLFCCTFSLLFLFCASALSILTTLFWLHIIIVSNIH